MRLLLGIVLGCFLTVGGAYLADSHNTSAAASGMAQRPMVNWDIVSTKWHHLSARAQSQWERLTANVDADHAVRPTEPRG